MQAHCGGNRQVMVPGATVRQVINSLEKEYPGSRDLLMDVEEDDLLPGLAVVVDGETSLLGLLERVQENSEVHFLPAIGGGETDDDVIHGIDRRQPLVSPPSAQAAREVRQDTALRRART